MMEKVQVLNISPAAHVVNHRGTVGHNHIGIPEKHNASDFSRPRDRKGSKPLTNTVSLNSNILNNNIEVNGISNGINSNNNNLINNNSNANGAARKKSSGSSNSSSNKNNQDRDEQQGSPGYVSERVRALSVSRPTSNLNNKFGHADFRASYNERIRSGPPSLQPHRPLTRAGQQEVGGGFVYMRGGSVGVPGPGGLYRSNSSLDLDHESPEEQPPASPLRREYGSHGSINVAASQPPESLYSMFRDLQPTDRLDPASASADSVAQELETVSPKVRSKLQKLWDKDKPSIFKKLRSSKSTEGKGEKLEINSETVSTTHSKGSSSIKSDNSCGDADSRSDEPLIVPKLSRRSAFAHYDCRSLAAQLNSTHMRSVLAERSNTTTGASAAAMAGVPGGSHHDSTEDLRPDDQDSGDGRSNSLVTSCPFFRNELGGEGERIISLSRDWGWGSPRSPNSTPPQPGVLHRPIAASTLGLLEPSHGVSHWRQTLCPYVRTPLSIEAVDQGASYYKNYFHGQEHQNWFGVDEALGPVAVSIRKEKVEDATDNAHTFPAYQYRIIIRSSELSTLRGTILEESLWRPGGEKGRCPGVREVLEYVCPSLSVGCLRQGQSTTQTEEALLKLDDLGVHKKFKVGVLYCRSGQTTEEDMYNNESGGPAFSEFLEVLGQRVRLKEFEKYRGGLDKKTDSTGLYSVYAKYRDCEVMFHVSTLLPYTHNNRKQLLRKRHIGNDIVTIIFQEPGAPPFSPKNIRSHFQHVFIVVQAINPCSDKTHYSVSVSRFRDVPMFGPSMPEGATFPKSRTFTEFLLAKVINGEIAALRSEKFTCMATRTRHEYLKDVSLNHSTATTIDTSSKFSWGGFSRSGKKDKRCVKFVPDNNIRGALSWPLSVHDSTTQQNVDCVLGISYDSIVVVEESSAAVIFAAPCRSVIGWTTKPNQGLGIFYHQGECLLIHLRVATCETDGEEILSEVLARLSAVTQGHETQELTLRRNSAGLLGFNVQQDGVITEVEPYGLAAQAGLRQGARLVEICTVTLATLSQEQMVDLLKTSQTVTVTVVPPHQDGAPRKGCNVPTCGFLLGGSEGDYENLSTPEEVSRKHSKSRHHHASRYDRSLSPPRSSNSSGYGTGNSSRSFGLIDNRQPQDYQETTRLNPPEYTIVENQNPLGDYDPRVSGDYGRAPDYGGTLSSTSSGHSSDRWCEPLEERQPQLQQQDSPPPPLPARLSLSSKRRGDHFESPSNPVGTNQAYVSPPPYYPATSILSNTSHSGPGSTSSQYLQLPLSSPAGGEQLGDGLADHCNYAVPPPHPRPLLTTSEDTHFSGLGDYDNAPLKVLETTARNRQPWDVNSESMNSVSITTTSTTTSVSEMQVSEYIAWRNERLGNRSSSLPGPVENHSSTERLHPAHSEDELSASSGSPNSRRRKFGGNITPSSTSSRNQSPRTVGTEARLRHAATPRKNNRNSANLGSSSLQEELFRLINPDYISDSECIGSNLGNLNNSGDRPRAYTVSHCGGPGSQGSRSNNSSLDRVSIKSGGAISNSGGTTTTPGAGSQCETIAVNNNDDIGSTNLNYSPAISQPPQFAVQNATPAHVSGTAPPSLSAMPHGHSYSNLPVSALPNQNVGINSKHLPNTNEIINNTGNNQHQQQQSDAPEVVVLTARPATVISNSSNTSSPAPTAEQNRHSTVPTADPNRPTAVAVNDTRSTKLDTRGQQTIGDRNSSILSNANDPGLSVSSKVDEEWTSLVNTATAAIQKSGDLLAAQPRDLLATHPQPSTNKPMAPSIPAASAQTQNTQPFTPTNLQQTAQRTTIEATSDQSLVERVAVLERALIAEQQRSEHLVDEVGQLRTENRKLQEDSRAAAQQLHQFTEWFFNTIDKT